jgi:hypothetical protein
MLIQFAMIAVSYFGAMPTRECFNVEARYIKGNECKSVLKIKVRDGQTAKLADVAQEPFVTSVDIAESGPPYTAVKPTIPFLDEGVSVKVNVSQRELRPISKNKVFLDATARVSEIGRVEVKLLDDHPAIDTSGNSYGTNVQAPSQTAKETRVLTPVTIGKPITISIDDRTHEAVEITVRRSTVTWPIGTWNWPTALRTAPGFATYQSR